MGKLEHWIIAAKKAYALPPDICEAITSLGAVMGSDWNDAHQRNVNQHKEEIEAFLAPQVVRFPMFPRNAPTSRVASEVHLSWRTQRGTAAKHALYHRLKNARRTNPVTVQAILEWRPDRRRRVRGTSMFMFMMTT